MDSLDEKYLKLLAQNDTLLKEVDKYKQSYAQLQQCDKAYRELHQDRMQLIGVIKGLYDLWLPPKLDSFFKSMWAWAKNGFKKSTEADAKWEICKSCPQLNNREMCTLCGCFMKFKSKLKGVKCPINKW